MTYATSLRAASTLAIATLLLASPAYADGVDAGTLIENTASASYSTGAGTQTVDSNTVTITVDELIDVTIASQDAGAVPITGGTAVLTYEVTNTGNGPEVFNLTADPAVAGNDFDSVIEAIVLDTNGNGVYDDGVDTVIANGGATGSIPADGTQTVFVIVSSPAGVTDGQSSEVNLLAEAATGTGTPGTVFPGAGEGGGDAVIGSSNADADTNGALIAAIASVTLVKSATIVDPFGGSEAVPGATVTFTIVASVSGSGSIDDLAVTDAIPADTTYSPNSLALDATSLTDASDTDAGAASDAAGIAVEIGTAAAGSDYTITFDVTID